MILEIIWGLLMILAGIGLVGTVAGSVAWLVRFIIIPGETVEDTKNWAGWIVDNWKEFLGKE